MDPLMDEKFEIMEAAIKHWFVDFLEDDMVQPLKKTEEGKLYTSSVADLFSVLEDQVQIVRRSSKCTQDAQLQPGLSAAAAWCRRKRMNDFQEAERKRLVEPASDIGLEPLCAMINNNTRCYELAIKLADSVIEDLPQNYAEQVNFQNTCQGFLEVTKDAVNATVRIIFEDPGVEELLVKLYHKEWSDGKVTAYLIATFGDYFTDVKMYVDEISFRRFVEACLEETIVVYVDHLLNQKNYIKEETIERMRLDEEYLMDFFREYITVSKVEDRFSILNDLRELASAESLDAITLVYTNILEHQLDCPPEVVEKLVALREGITEKDSKEVVQECNEIYTNSLVDGNSPKAGFLFPWLKCLIAKEGSGEVDQEKLTEEMRQRMLDLRFSSVDV